MIDRNVTVIAHHDNGKKWTEATLVTIIADSVKQAVEALATIEQSGDPFSLDTLRDQFNLAMNSYYNQPKDLPYWMLCEKKKGDKIDEQFVSMKELSNIPLSLSALNPRIVIKDFNKNQLAKFFNYFDLEGSWGPTNPSDSEVQAILTEWR